MFYVSTGANRIYTIGGIIVYAFIVLVFAISTTVNPLSFTLVIGSFASIFLIHLINQNPAIGINLLFIISFFVVGIARILPLPLGLAIDALTVLTWLIIIFKHFNKANWSIIWNTLTTGYTIWFLYCLFLIMNPEGNKVAYIYAIRDLALKGFLIPPLLFAIYNKPKNYTHFINTWFIMSILLGLYGAKQYWIGVFAFEQHWLDTAGAKTHVLWGEFVRMFSFLASANQFGSSQAHVASVAIIFSITESSLRKRLFYILTAIICIYGMVISGTRASIVIPIVALAIYLIFSRNFKILISGAILGGIVLHLLVNTHIMHSNSAIRRIRTTFDYKNDASYIVRMENRKELKAYMASRPFGGGIGSVGDWGHRFTPNTFLGQFPTDGQYVKIYAETGITGLWLYSIIHIAILLKMFYTVWNIKDSKLRNEMTGLLAGLIAAHVVNHTSHFTGGLPTLIVNLFCLSFILIAKQWDTGKQFEFSQKPYNHE